MKAEDAPKVVIADLRSGALKKYFLEGTIALTSSHNPLTVVQCAPSSRRDSVHPNQSPSFGCS